MIIHMKEYINNLMLSINVSSIIFCIKTRSFISTMK